MLDIAPVDVFGLLVAFQLAVIHVQGYLAAVHVQRGENIKDPAAQPAVAPVEEIAVKLRQAAEKCRLYAALRPGRLRLAGGQELLYVDAQGLRQGVERFKVKRYGAVFIFGQGGLALANSRRQRLLRHAARPAELPDPVAHFRADVRHVNAPV